MNDIASGTEPARDTNQHETSPAQLRDKLKNFAVRDRQGKLIGEVRDVDLGSVGSKEYVNLVIAQPDSFGNDRLFLLSSKNLHKIDVSTRSLFTNLDQAQINLLSYESPVTSDEPSELSASSTAPIEVTQIQSQTEDATQTITMPALTESEDLEEFGHNSVQSIPIPETVAAEVIRLLEERLVVNRSKRKVGEIIVRKEIETRLVEVPIRREKLIIEQVGAEHRQLAEIDIGLGEVRGVDFHEATSVASEPVVRGEFTSPNTVIRLLDAIAKTIRHRCKQIKIELIFDNREGQRTYHEFSSPKMAIQVLDAIAQKLDRSCKQVKVELLLEDKEIQKTYQDWFDRYRN